MKKINFVLIALMLVNVLNSCQTMIQNSDANIVQSPSVECKFGESESVSILADGGVRATLTSDCDKRRINLQSLNKNKVFYCDFNYPGRAVLVFFTHGSGFKVKDDFENPFDMICDNLSEKSFGRLTVFSRLTDDPVIFDVSISNDEKKDMQCVDKRAFINKDTQYKIHNAKEWTHGKWFKSDIDAAGFFCDTVIELP
ncbi:MAG: hypothetical protein HRU38_05625 [Saccharospirillaceae bacterium]|nr:hypothetical protein [Pseudomonadales bacterium]NRB78136.1 hypothetical protein [Saccharospirillaceae bacterium]